jgi:predicted 3-demethylubiquinone-9 3-methyltransferase (glyoxalase superfamily)
MQKITTFLAFNDRGEEAMDFYISIFKNAKILGKMNHGGKFMGGSFQIEGQTFNVLNGGPHFTFTEGISLFVNCETQEEIDELWEKLSAGGQTSRCGWLKDKFGLSWQIIPPVLGQLLQGKDSAKSKRVMEAMLKMDKIIIKTLEGA